MSSAKKTTDNIVNEIKCLKKTQSEFNGKLDVLTELINHIHAKIADISCKIDLSSAASNLQTSSKSTVKKTKSVSPSGDKKPNIMTYFKLKFKEDRKSLSDIISEEELKELYEKNEDELKTKKKSTLESAKITLVYKELIKNNENKLKLLRLMKEKEEEEEIEKHQKEIHESEILDDEYIDVDEDVEADIDADDHEEEPEPEEPEETDEDYD